MLFIAARLWWPDCVLQGSVDCYIYTIIYVIFVFKLFLYIPVEYAVLNEIVGLDQDSGF